MTSEDVYAVLDKLREKHHMRFEHWYDTAGLISVKEYCELGWLLRYWDSLNQADLPSLNEHLLGKKLVDAIKQLRPDAIDHIDPKPEWWVRTDELLKQAEKIW